MSTVRSTRNDPFVPPASWVPERPREQDAHGAHDLDFGESAAILQTVTSAPRTTLAEELGISRKQDYRELTIATEPTSLAARRTRT
jgi:hypothetical protein